MTVISRRFRFVYLKSQKTAGTSVEAHLLTQTPLGGDIWNSAGEICKYDLPLQNRNFLIGSLGNNIVVAPRLLSVLGCWPWRLRIQEHHDATGLSGMLGGFWRTAVKATSVRNPWDLMVSAWQWRRDGRGGWAQPITAGFIEWLSAALSSDTDWRNRVSAYDPRLLIHPFLFIDGKCAVDFFIRQEAIDDGLGEVGKALNVDLGRIAVRE